VTVFPLAETYPGLATLPLAGIASLPTPVERLDVGEDVRALFIKRDDLTSERYGGNKVRKLDLLLGRATSQERRAVITFGAYGSNHALATAVHARALGLEPHVVLSPQAPGPYAARTLRAHAGLGTVLHVVEDWDGKRAAVSAKRELTERDGVEPLVIPMGGTNPLGAIGYVNAAFELAEQAGHGRGPAGALQGREAFEMPDVIYVAGGTLGTAIGLAIGFALVAPDTRVVAVRVTPTEVGGVRIAEKLAADTVVQLRVLDAAFPTLAFEDLRFELREDWYEPGYGVVTPETTRAVQLAGSAGIKLETTYTGKALAALLGDARAHRLRESRVLFWDTYSSAPMPAEGPDEALPEELQAYVAECDRLFGRATVDAAAAASPAEGDAE